MRGPSGVEEGHPGSFSGSLRPTSSGSPPRSLLSELAREEHQAHLLGPVGVSPVEPLVRIVIRPDVATSSHVANCPPAFDPLPRARARSRRGRLCSQLVIVREL